MTVTPDKTWSLWGQQNFLSQRDDSTTTLAPTGVRS